MSGQRKLGAGQRQRQRRAGARPRAEDQAFADVLNGSFRRGRERERDTFVFSGVLFLVFGVVSYKSIYYSMCCVQM